jgi:hypothetical protein
MAILKERIMIFTLLWLGGILLCATPYLWALYCAARDAARPIPPRREPPNMTSRINGGR